MASKTKTKKTVTPLKNVEEPVKTTPPPSKFASPLTGEYVDPGDNDGVTDAPYEKSKEPTVDDIISGEYGYCINSLTGPQRALLSELIRVRLLMEGK